jgi:hypothetical protein|tara:strand:- start:33 stop:503 length:471 start_codon:yes stop_codon:yes gene_type:complete
MNINDDETNGNIKVINKEYDRVLSNPENVIMSDALQDLIDLPMPPHDAVDTVDSLSAEQFMVTVLDTSGIPFTVRGDLIKISSSNSNYDIVIETANVRKEFLACLEESTVTNSLTLLLSGMYETEVQTTSLTWSLNRSMPYSYHLSISFRSEDAIF